MAQQDNSIPGTGSGNTYIDSLLWGCGWDMSDGPITICFGSGPISDIPGQTGEAWTQSEIDAFTQILQNYENVCGLEFEVVASTTDADMVEWKLHQDFFDPNVLAQHEVPDETFTQTYGYYNVDTAYWGNFNLGSDAYFAIMHELGHAVGLAHPHDGGNEADATVFPGVSDPFDSGDFGLNQGIWTAMSYVRGWGGAPPPADLSYGEASNLMAFDVAALQYLYGANMSYQTGNNTYTLDTANGLGTSWSCIWDAGGVDTITNAGSSLACIIDLREAPLVGPNAGGYVSHVLSVSGGFTIANGALIENATGGNGNDSLTGNESANTLSGNNGDDYLVGRGGADTLLGGADNDTLIGDGRSGISLGDGSVVKNAGAGNSAIATAINISSEFSLAADPDITDATGTPHVSISGQGDGTVDFYSVQIANPGAIITVDVDHTSGFDSLVTVYDSDGNVVATDNSSFTSDGAGGSISGQDPYLTYSAAEAGVYYIAVGTYPGLGPVPSGTQYELQVSVGDELYAGASGDDTLKGGLGADTLDGSAGVDTADYSDKTSAVVVTLNGANNVTVTVGGVAEDTIRNIENVIGGSGADTLTGDGNANLFRGGLGVDTLNGGAGAGDTADYSDKTSAVTVVLNGATNATVTVGVAAEDTIKNIENVIGGSGADTLTGDAGLNVLSGGNGKDTLQGGLGADTLNGGGDVDTADYRDKTTSVVVTLNGGSFATVTVGGVAEDTIKNIENVYGGTAADTLTGDANANFLYGFSGDDLLKGGLGADQLDGYTGVDTADYSDKTTSVVVTLTGSTFAAVSVGGVAEDTIRNIENVIGGSAGDTLTGDNAANALTGNGGIDTLSGGNGNDTLQGGLGADTLNGGGDVDTADYRDKTTSVAVTLNGGNFVTVTVGGVAEDTIKNIENVYGGTVADTLTGDANANFLYGFSGDDLLKGGLGADQLDGYTGVDTADYSDKTAAVVVTLNGSTFVPVTIGGVAEDSIRNIERVYGGTAADTLVGDAAANLFCGGGGSDALTGAGASDIFLFNTTLNAAANLDHLTDFTTLDEIDIDNAVFTALTTTGTLASTAFYSAAGATSAHDTDDRIVYNSTNGVLYYDADGNQTGGVAAIEFAVVDTHAALTNADFVVV